MSERVVYYGTSNSHREWMNRLKKLLRVDIEDRYGGLEAAKNEALKGKGVVWLFSHTMKNDGLALITLLRSDPVLADRDLLLPMSDTLFHDRKYRLTQKPLRTTFVPVVTPEDRRKKKSNASLPSGLRTYLTESLSVLGRGGMVAIAPQAEGNTNTFDLTSPTRALSTFLGAMSEPDGSLVCDFVVVPVGISSPHAAEKGKPQKGMHMGRTISMNIGTCMTVDEILKEAAMYGGDVDLWGYNTIARLLPPSAVKRRQG